MKSIWIYVLFLSSVNSNSDTEVKGFAGRDIIIKCSFKNSQHGKTKYFCKMDANTKINKCPFESVSTETDSRYSKYYTVHNRILSVFIRNLTQKDSGNYQCGEHNGDERIGVNLRISEGSCCSQPISVTGHVGGSVKISCRYPRESEDNIKHFCKLTQDYVCADLIGSNTDEIKRRFFIAHRRADRVFIVTIRPLTSTDSGVYWCAVRTEERIGTVTLITQVNLKVIDKYPDSEPPSTPSPSPTLASSSTSSLLSSSSSAPAATSSRPSGQPVVIVLCVGAAVVVVVITAVFMFFRCFHHKSSNPAFSSTETCSENRTKRAPPEDCVYEEIKDTSISSHPESVYALAQLPSQPSEDPGSSTVNFNRQSKDNDDASWTGSNCQGH